MAPVGPRRAIAVLAVLVLPLPREHQTHALRYGIIGAFAFRIVATLFAVHLIAWSWIKLIGGLYLLYLPWKHFSHHESGSMPKAATAILGLSVFWSTVVRVETTPRESSVRSERDTVSSPVKGATVSSIGACERLVAARPGVELLSARQRLYGEED